MTTPHPEHSSSDGRLESAIPSGAMLEALMREYGTDVPSDEALRIDQSHAKTVQSAGEAWQHLSGTPTVPHGNDDVMKGYRRVDAEEAALLDQDIRGNRGNFRHLMLEVFDERDGLMGTWRQVD